VTKRYQKLKSEQKWQTANLATTRLQTPNPAITLRTGVRVPSNLGMRWILKTMANDSLFRCSLELKEHLLEARELLLNP